MVRHSIRTKLVLAISVPLLGAYAAMTWCEYQLGHREALANSTTHLAEVAARRASELDADLTTAAESVRTIARLIAATPELNEERLKVILQDNLVASPQWFGMSAAFERNGLAPDAPAFAMYYCRDPRGSLRYVDVAAAVPQYRELDWYRPARETGRPYWTEPYFDAGIGERLMCTYTAPVLRDGQFRGVVTVDILSETLLSDLVRLRLDRGYCTLISGRGAFISHPDSSLVMHKSIFSLADEQGIDELATAGRDMLAGKTGARRIRDYVSGEPKWMVYAPVPSAGWSLAAVIPESEVLAPVYVRLWRALGILVVGLAVILGIVLLVSHRVTEPIGRLAAATEVVGHGNLDAQLTGPFSDDEVGRLARQFNTMLAELKSNIERRIREEASRREVEGELKAARSIQASLLPAMLPPDPERGFALHAVNAPAKHVAGDFFDFFFVDERRVAVVMADVSGKGLPAAMYMAVARTRLRDHATADRSPADVVSEVNRRLAQENNTGMFVSLFFGYYDMLTGVLEYTNAGHNPPYVVRANGTLVSLDPTGPLVAPFPSAVFSDAQCALDPGDLLVLFTDGITEAGVRDGELYGESRLEHLLLELQQLSVEELCGRLIATATDFSAGELADDVTVLSLRRLNRSAGCQPAQIQKSTVSRQSTVSCQSIISH